MISHIMRTDLKLPFKEGEELDLGDGFYVNIKKVIRREGSYGLTEYIGVVCDPNVTGECIASHNEYNEKAVADFRMQVVDERGGWIFLFWGGVRRDIRRQGIATDMICLAEKVGRENDLKGMTSYAANPTSIKLHLSYGFKVTSVSIASWAAPDYKSGLDLEIGGKTVKDVSAAEMNYVFNEKPNKRCKTKE